MSAAAGATRILVLGAGGHAAVVADIVLRAEDAGSPMRLLGFLDDRSETHGTDLLGRPVLGSLAEITAQEFDGLVVAIGDNRRRADLIESLDPEQQAALTAVIHPSAVIAPDTVIGAGAMVAAGAVINPGTVIGENVIVNTGCTIDHHCHVGACAHIAPGAHLGGNVRVGSGALIGIGSVVTPGCEIGDWATIGAGAAVVDSVAAEATAVGVPARSLPRPVRGR